MLCYDIEKNYHPLRRDNMKKHYFIVIFAMFLTTTLRAQDTNAHIYQSVFGDSLTEWYARYGNYDRTYMITMHLLSYSQDTISMDSNTYHYLINDEDDYGWCNNIVNIGGPHLLRETPSHDKLYITVQDFCDGDTLPEMLLMDLSLEAGDTINTYNWWTYLCLSGYHAPIPTIRIDSVFYVDGRKVQKTNYSVASDSYSDTLLYIEGIGPSVGLLYPFFRGIYSNLNCYIQDNDIVYKNMNRNGCSDRGYQDNCECCWWVGVDDVEAVTVSIRPNPVHDVLHIEMADSGPTALTFVSADGRFMLQREVQGEHVEVNVSAMPSGVYTLTIQNKQHSTIKKIVKL